MNFIKLIFLFALIVAIFSSCDENSTDIKSKNYSGWGIGQRLHNGSGVVIHTSDSGTEWELQADTLLFKDVIMTDVTAISPKTAIVSGYSDENGQGYIFRTTDEGKTWQKLNLPVEASGKSIGCVRSNGSTVIAGGDDGLFLVSNDLGNTWLSKNIPDNREDGAVLRIDLDGNDRFIAHVSSSSTDQTIYYSYDGGDTWHPHTTMPPEWVSIIDVSWVKGTDIIWASGAYRGSDGIIAVSHDAGKNWVAIDSAGMSHFNAIYAFDEDHIFAGADHMIFQRTSDGGKNWDRQNLTYNDIWIGGISAVTKNDLWVFGSGYDSPIIAHSTILYSSDGGNSWQEQNVPEDVSALWRVSFVR